MITLRRTQKEQILIVCNFDREQTIALPQQGKLLLSNYADRQDGISMYRPFEIAVYEL